MPKFPRNDDGSHANRTSRTNRRMGGKVAMRKKAISSTMGMRMSRKVRAARLRRSAAI